MLPGLVIDVDASLVTCHSEKESAAATFKGGFGYHPLLAFLDNTGEALAGILRPRNAGSNTAADHITVTDMALAQIPDAERHGGPILVRADGAGATRDWLVYLSGLGKSRGLEVEFSVGFTMTKAVQAAIDTLPKTAWTPAIEADGSVRDGADVAEVTDLLEGLTDAGWPETMRVIVRRERPHPGAQLSLFDQRDGLRYQAFATDTAHGQLAHLEARHRAPRPGRRPHHRSKDHPFGRFPSRLFALNAAWLELALTGIDLIAWTQHLLLDGDLATCEPKALRYRLLFARISCSSRIVRVSSTIAAGTCPCIPQPASPEAGAAPISG